MVVKQVDLLTWLHQRMWPYESSMSREDHFVSSLLCSLELIRSGVTTFAEAGGALARGGKQKDERKE